MFWIGLFSWEKMRSWLVMLSYFHVSLLTSRLIAFCPAKQYHDSHFMGQPIIQFRVKCLPQESLMMHMYFVSAWVKGQRPAYTPVFVSYNITNNSPLSKKEVKTIAWPPWDDVIWSGHLLSYMICITSDLMVSFKGPMNFCCALATADCPVFPIACMWWNSLSVQ